MLDATGQNGIALQDSARAARLEGPDRRRPRRRLRMALNHGGRPDIIRTARSAGYAFDAEEADL